MKLMQAATLIGKQILVSWTEIVLSYVVHKIFTKFSNFS